MSEDGSYIPMQVEGQHNAAQVPQVILSETILPPVIPKVENPFVPEFSPTVSYTPIQITRWGDADAGEIVTTRLPETNAANLRSALNDLCVSHIAIFGPLIEKKGISYILAHGPKLMAKDHTMRDMAGTIIQVAADHRRSPELRLGSLKSFVSDLDKLGQRHIPMDDADLRAQGIDRRSIEQKILSTEDTQARLLQKVLEQMGSGSGKRSRMVPTRSQTDKDMLQLRDKLVSPETRPSVSHWITFAGKPPEDWMVLTNVYNKLDFDGHQLHEEGGLYVPPLHFGLGQYATLSFAIDPTSPDEYLKLPGIVIESLPTASDSMPLLELSQLFLEDETGDVVDLRPFVRINGLGQYVLDAKHLSSGMKERLMAHNVTAIFDKHCIGPIHPPVQQSAEWSPFQDAEKLLCERAVERVHDPDKAIQWLGSEISHTYLYSKSATTPQPGDTTGASSIDRFFLRGGGSCYEANLALCKLISAGKLGDAYVLAGKPGKEATDGVYFIESSQDGHAMTLARPKGGSWQVLDATPVFKSYEEMAEAQSDVATQDQINALAKTRDTLLEQIMSRMGTTHYSDEPLDTLNSLNNPFGKGKLGANFTHLDTSGFTTGAEFTRPPDHKTISGRILENAALLRTLISTVQNALGVQPVSISEPLLAHFGLQNTDLNPNILEHLTGVNRIRERDLVIASTLNPVDRLWVPPMPKLNSPKRWRELVDTPTGYLNTADKNISALVSTLKDVAQPTALDEFGKKISNYRQSTLTKINHVLQGHGLPPLLERTDLPFIAPVLNASLGEMVELLRYTDANKSISPFGCR